MPHYVNFLIIFINAKKYFFNNESFFKIKVIEDLIHFKNIFYFQLFNFNLFFLIGFKNVDFFIHPYNNEKTLVEVYLRRQTDIILCDYYLSFYLLVGNIKNLTISIIKI